jgi:hypothetical protein
MGPDTPPHPSSVRMGIGDSNPHPSTVTNPTVTVHIFRMSGPRTDGYPTTKKASPDLHLGKMSETVAVVPPVGGQDDDIL